MTAASNVFVCFVDVSFPPKVTALLKSLNDRKIIKHGDFDIQSKRCASDSEIVRLTNQLNLMSA